MDKLNTGNPHCLDLDRLNFQLFTIAINYLYDGRSELTLSILRKIFMMGDIE